MTGWLSAVLAALQVLVAITKFLERRRIIGEVEADLVRKIILRDEEISRAVQEARDRVERDAAAGKLRDDDGHRRD